MLNNHYKESSNNNLFDNLQQKSPPNTHQIETIYQQLIREKLEREYIAHEYKKEGKKLMGVGLIGLTIGALITGITYSTANNGGSYLLFWGPMAFGFLTIMRGIWLYLHSFNVFSTILDPKILKKFVDYAIALFLLWVLIAVMIDKFF